MKRAFSVLLGLMVGWALPADAETLELRIVSDGGATYFPVQADFDDTVNVYIQGRLSNTTTTKGLALWFADVHNSGTLEIDLADTNAFLLEAPSGLAAHFDRDGGFTNPPGSSPGPSGYSGTADANSDGLLLQLGGGQNTINNSDPPAYPVGSVGLEVCNTTSWTTLAQGTIKVNGDVGDEVVLNLRSAYATTIDLGETGPEYAVSPVKIEIDETPLTIRSIAWLGAAYSVGNHQSYGSWGGGDIYLEIYPYTNVGTAGLSEPRLFDNGTDRLRIVLAFWDEIDADSVGVEITPDPGEPFTLTQASAWDIEFEWDSNGALDSWPVGTQVYRFNLTGNAAGWFEIAFVQGDVNCSGHVTTADRNEIDASGNWNKQVNQASNQKCDIDRNGVIDNWVDRTVVVNVLFHGPSAQVGAVCP